MEEAHRAWRLLALVLCAAALRPCAASAIPPNRAGRGAEPPCGKPPELLEPLDTGAASCWAAAAAPDGSLAYSPPAAQGARRLSAVSWDDLQELVDGSDGPLHIRLPDTLTVSRPLRVDGRAGLVLQGPAELRCKGAASAVVITRSSGVVLQDLTVLGCTSSAVVVNGTASTAPITAAGAPPDVVLWGVELRGCAGERGSALSVLRGRVALDRCTLSGNVASGCGAAVYADRSSLLVVDSTFEDNLGNNTAIDGTCRGGALHAQSSWLGVARSNFTSNAGVNGSALLLLDPQGVAQLHDCQFRHNRQRDGVSRGVSSSAGAVAVRGRGTFGGSLERGAAVRCSPVRSGLVVARCTFANNTAALTGGEGGALGAYGTFVAVINSTFRGGATAAGDASSPSAAHAPPAASSGGCVAVQDGGLLVSRSLLAGCGARFVGGAVSALGSQVVVEHSTMQGGYADMGGCMRTTNGALILRNSSVSDCRALSSGGGLYFESNQGMEADVQGCTLSDNLLTGRGGGLLAERLSEHVKLRLLINDTTIERNQGAFGGGLCVYSAEAHLVGNVIAHNRALKVGGGLECQITSDGDNMLHTRGNLFLNNTALVRGGGAHTRACEVKLFGDRFLANSAREEGGGYALYGGEDALVSGALLSCNAARTGAGVVVKLSDNNEPAALRLVCSAVTANGGGASAEAQRACLAALGERALAAPPASGGGAAAAADEAEAAAAAAAAAVAAGGEGGAERGGGLLVSANQSATVALTLVAGNRASSSGGGIYLEEHASLAMQGPRSEVSRNNCTGGSGGGIFMESGSTLNASGVRWAGNQGMFGGAFFAMGTETRVNLKWVEAANNTAAAGGAVATLGGSHIDCWGGCRFAFNSAKVGGALMLHDGSNTLRGSELLANVAGAGAGVAPSSTAPGGGETVQYMLGAVAASAGGAVYVWRGELLLDNCTLDGNVAWGGSGRGGGAFVDDATLTLRGSRLTHNWASAAGGGALLGPFGARQRLVVDGGLLAGNSAGMFGGGVAAGLLLHADTSAAAARARGSGAGAASGDASGDADAEDQWAVELHGVRLENNTAGRQGGGVACSMCGSLRLQGSALARNGAVQTGGGVSCVGCRLFSSSATNFTANSAASGGGACVLAAGAGSSSAATNYERNTAGEAPAAAARARLRNAAVAAAGLALGGASSPAAAEDLLAAASPDDALPKVEQALPACGVVGTGGGLCLGLWRVGFVLEGAGAFVGNMALFGAGLFIEACADGPKVCPVELGLHTTRFAGNSLSDDAGTAAGPSRRLLRQLQQEQRDAASASADSGGALQHMARPGTGADLYVTNATVLVAAQSTQGEGQKQKQQMQQKQQQGGAGSEAPAAERAAAKRAAPEGGQAAVESTAVAPPQAAAPDASAGESGGSSSNSSSGDGGGRVDGDSTAPSGRRLLAPAVQGPASAGDSVAPSNASSLLAVAKQLAASTAPPNASGSGVTAVSERVATGPAQLSRIYLVGRPGQIHGGDNATDGPGTGAAKSLMGGEAVNVQRGKADGGPDTVIEGWVDEDGRLVAVELAVLDQLGGRVPDEMAMQLSVQADLEADMADDCRACSLQGISKVLPVNGTARFDQLQLQAKPGQTYKLKFTLLSAVEGTELTNATQSLRVALAKCSWGQATTNTGCYNCTSPMFSFKRFTDASCSLCPDNVYNCSGTTLLPAQGYWNSGPLSTRMHKCPRRNACMRNTTDLLTMRCLQQWRLILANLGVAGSSATLGEAIGNRTARRAAPPPTEWDKQLAECLPVLEELAANASGGNATGSGAGAGGRRRALLQAAGGDAASSPSPSPALAALLNNSAALDVAYAAEMCAVGYSGRLCSNCVFPGSGPNGAYGQFVTGCGRCPSWAFSVAAYVLSRVVDIALVGLLVLTTLVEMRRRRLDVQAARQAAIGRKVAGGGGAPGAPPPAAAQQQAQQQQLGRPQATAHSMLLPTATLSGVISRQMLMQQGGTLPPGAVAAAMAASAAAAAAGADDADAATPFMGTGLLPGGSEGEPEDAPMAPMGSTSRDQLRRLELSGKQSSEAAAADATQKQHKQQPLLQLLGSGRGSGGISPHGSASGPVPPHLSAELMPVGSGQLASAPARSHLSEQAQQAPGQPLEEKRQHQGGGHLSSPQPSGSQRLLRAWRSWWGPRGLHGQPPLEQQASATSASASGLTTVSSASLTTQTPFAAAMVREAQLSWPLSPDQRQALEPRLAGGGGQHPLQLRQRSKQGTQCSHQLDLLEERGRAAALAGEASSACLGGGDITPSGSLAAHDQDQGPHASHVAPLPGATAGGGLPLAPVATASALAAPPLRRSRRRGPLFAREHPPGSQPAGSSQSGGPGGTAAPPGARRAVGVVNYSPASLTTGALFEVFKDFLQVLSILQAVLVGWQAATAAALSAVSVTPLSSKAWISLDCILPRTDAVARKLPVLQIAASLALPVIYALLLLSLWALYAAVLSLRTGQALFRVVLGRRLKAPIVSSLLVLLSYFYPALAYTVLGTFSCRYLDPPEGAPGSDPVPGEVLNARGWFWAQDLETACFTDRSHRALALGLGVPGSLALLAYPLAQWWALARKAAAGQLTPTSEFFGNYGHLVEDFRPRLFYWGSVVELRKLVLVAVVLGLASTGVISQLVGCSLVLLAFLCLTMGVLPFPHRVLNRLHLASSAVLLAVVWLNLFVAVGEEGGALSSGIAPGDAVALQLLSLVLVAAMIATLLGMCALRLYRRLVQFADVDGDGRVSAADLRALLARLQAAGSGSAIGRACMPCIAPRAGAGGAAAGGGRGAAAAAAPAAAATAAAVPGPAAP